MKTSRLSPPLGPRLLTEFVGTGLLMFTVALLATSPMIPPLATAGIITVVLTVLVAVGSPLSGAHFNPAISTGVWASRGLRLPELAAYIGSQLTGAVGATSAVSLLGQGHHLPLFFHTPSALLAEATGAFLIMTATILLVRRQSHRTAAGLTIGLTVGLGGLVLGSLSGAAFNPAVWLGLTRLGRLTLEDWPVYLIGPIAGGFMAVAIFGRSPRPTAEPRPSANG